MRAPGEARSKSIRASVESGRQITLCGAASWWQITSVSGGGGPNERHTAPGGGRNPNCASWNIRSMVATATSASSVTQSGPSGYEPHSPSRYDSTSRLRSSMPSARGAPVNPTYSRWRSSAWTAGVHGPTLRRTVSPTRTTVLVFPPSSGISCCVTRSPPGDPRLRVRAKQRVDELGRIERRKVIGTLAEANQLHRNAQSPLYRDDDAALCRTVQLGQDHAGHVAHLGEHPGLLKAVLAGGRVEDEQGLVDRAVLLHHPLDLAQLVHQADLVLQPPRRVDQYGVHAGLGAPPYRVEGHRGRVAALLTPDHLGPHPTGPGRELLGGGRAERVGGPEDDRVPVRDQHPRDPAARRRLAGAVHPDH